MDPGKSLPSLLDCMLSDSKEMEVEETSVLVTEVIEPINDQLNKVQIVAPIITENVSSSTLKTPKCIVKIATVNDKKIGKSAETSKIKEVFIPLNDQLNKVQIVAPKIAQNVSTSALKNPKCIVKIATVNDKEIAKTPQTSKIKEVIDPLNKIQIVPPKIAQNVSTSAIKTSKCTVKIANPVDSKQVQETGETSKIKKVIEPDKEIIGSKISQNVSTSAQKTIKIAIPVDPETATAASNSGAQVVTGNLSGGPYIVAIPPNSKPTKTPNPALPLLVPLPPGVSNQNGQLVLKPGSSSQISALKMVPHSSGTPALMSLGEKGQYFVAINPTSSGAISVNVTPSLVTEKGKVTTNSANITPAALNDSLKLAMNTSKPLAPALNDSLKKVVNSSKPLAPASNDSLKIAMNTSKPLVPKTTDNSTPNKPTNDKSPKKLPPKQISKNKKNWTPVSGIKLLNLKNKLLKNSSDKQLMNSYSCLEKSYLKTNKISKMRLDRLKRLKAHYKSTLNKITDLCASIQFAADNVEALIPYTSVKRQGCHRWSYEERIIAISLLRKSPSSYRILRPVFNLPSHKCLRFSLERQNCRAGVNKFIFNALKVYIAKLDPLDRICCLSFDQTEIKVHTQFDTHFDKILGLVDIGFQQGRSKLCGDHIVVFELKSLRKKWSMPIAYFFTKGEMQPLIARRLLLKIIAECHAIGVEIMSTSCPMYNNFRETLKLMGSDKDKPMFEFQEKFISTIYDPAHLLVLSRDELYRNNVAMNICIDGEAEMLQASWTHIEQAYDTDIKNTFPKLYKIKKDDLDPIKTKSINIKQAARCLSNSVASVINQQVVTGLFDKETLATAHYVGKLNETFDSLNGTSSRAKGARGLKCHLKKSKEDIHIDFWLDTSRDIETWIFSDDSQVPDGWIITLRGILALWTNLKEKGFTSLELKQFSNDSLRSMFKGMKSFYKTRMLNFTQFDEAFKNCANNYLINMHGGMDPYAFNNHKLYTSPLKGCSSKLPRKLKQDKTFKKYNLQFSQNFLKCFSLCHVVKTIASLLSHKTKCSKCLCVLFDSSGFRDEGFIFKSNEEDLYPRQNLIESISSCVNDYEACIPKHMHKDRISFAVPEEMLKKFKTAWLKQGCSTHFKTISKDIVHMTFESMSIWWGRKLAKDHNQLIVPEITKKRIRNPRIKKKRKVSYVITEEKFVDESNIEETIIDFNSPSKYCNNILNSIIPNF